MGCEDNTNQCRRNCSKIKINVKMQRTFSLPVYYCLLVVGSLLIIETQAISSTPKTTTVATSSTTKRPSPVVQATVATNSSRPNRAQIIRKRRLGIKLRKRQGQIRFEDENNSSPEDQQQQQQLLREPLYETQVLDRPSYRTPVSNLNQGSFDDYDKSPYYSPIKRQRQKKTRRFKTQQPQQEQQGYPHLTSVNPSYPTPSEAPSNLNYGRYSNQNYQENHPNQNHHPQDDHQNFQEFSTAQPAPKNYAFAYAVRDDNNSEDFSHKEARDGKLTMGEYRINLPDGRVQVVRYTAGGKIGYKADVTYEGDDPRNKELAKTVSPSKRPKNVAPKPGPPYSYSEPTSSVQKKFTSQPSSSPDTYSSNNHEGPVYLSRPLKSRRPSLSPSSIYPNENYPQSDSQPLYRAGPTSVSYYNGIDTTARPKSIYDKIPSTSSKKKYQGNLAFLHEQSPRAGPSKNGGNGYHIEASPSKESFYSNPTNEPYYSPHSGPDFYYDSPGPTAPSSPVGFNYKSPKPSNLKPNKPSTRNYHEEDSYGPSTYTPIKSGNSGGLIPINEFKAGPLRKKFKKNKSKSQPSAPSIPNFRKFPDGDHHPKYPHQQYQSPFPPPLNQNQNYQYINMNHNGPNRPQSQQQSYLPSFNSPSSVRYKEPFHYYNSQHASYHHGGYSGPPSSPSPPISIHQQQVNPSSSDYSVDYPGGGKESFYLKSGPQRPLKPGRRNRNQKTSSGLVYLETPGEGPRPNDIGVKEALDRLPNMPPQDPHTSIHPYEVGSKDYGHSVGYKNSDAPPRDNHHAAEDDFHQHDYIPQLNTNHFDTDHHHQDHSQDSLRNYHRDYLYEGNTQDSIVQSQPRLVNNPSEGVEQTGADETFQY